MAGIAKRVVGFECEFIEEPPKYLQTECPICLLILREPYQVTCCGKSFCKECIERTKTEKRACPCCNRKTFNDFPNKGLQQPLYAFQVHCSNKEDGCEWKGELGQLDNHLNWNNLKQDIEGCAFANIKCSYCFEIVAGNSLQHHKNELCDKRPFSCEHCNDYESTYDDVIHNHWPVCGSHPVKCPNKCGTFCQRQHCAKHVSSDCLLTVLECDFNYAGCQVKLPRKEMPDHIKDSLVPHFSLLALSHKKQQEEIRTQQKQICILKENQIKLEKRLHYTGTFPVEFTVQDADQYNNPYHEWTSEHFYSHPNGYKLCLRFNKNPINNNFIFRCCIMKGEFDDGLKWPLNTVIEIHIEDAQRRFISLLKIEVADGKQPKDRMIEETKDSGSVEICNCQCFNVKVVSVKIKKYRYLDTS